MVNSARAIANAATRSAIEGSNFGDNLRASIPDVVGQALGDVVGGALASPTQSVTAQAAENPTQNSAIGAYSGAEAASGDQFFAAHAGGYENGDEVISVGVRSNNFSDDFLNTMFEARRYAFNEGQRPGYRPPPSMAGINAINAALDTGNARIAYRDEIRADTAKDYGVRLAEFDPANALDPSDIRYGGSGDVLVDLMHWLPGHFADTGKAQWNLIVDDAQWFGNQGIKTQRFNLANPLAATAAWLGPDSIDLSGLKFTGLDKEYEDAAPWIQAAFGARALPQSIRSLANLFRKNADEIVGKSDFLDDVDIQIDGFVWRADSRSPSDIFENGFTALGDSQDLFLHALNNRMPPSAFVSTSKSYRATEDFGDLVYAIDRPANGIDVNLALGSRSPYPNELEVAVPRHISNQSIRGATYRDQGVTVLNPYVYNY